MRRRVAENRAELAPRRAAAASRRTPTPPAGPAAPPPLSPGSCPPTVSTDWVSATTRSVTASPDSLSRYTKQCTHSTACPSRRSRTRCGQGSVLSAWLERGCEALGKLLRDGTTLTCARNPFARHAERTPTRTHSTPTTLWHGIPIPVSVTWRRAGKQTPGRERVSLEASWTQVK